MRTSFSHTQLPINEEKCFDKFLNNDNFKETIKKEHDIIWKANYFKSAEVSMI